jgi:MFS family permease
MNDPARVAPATRWDIVLMALGAGILAGFQVGKVPPSLPVLRETLGLDLITAGWLTSIYYAIGAVSAVAVGLLSDRAGPRRLMLTGMVFLGAGSLMGGMVESGTLLLISRFIEGFGFVGITVTAPKLIATAARPQDHGMAFGIWGAYMPIGMAIAMLIAPALLDSVGWRGFWLVSAVIVALFMLCLAWSLRIQRWPVTFEAQALDWAGVRATLARPALWLFGFCFALYTLQWFAIMSFLPTFLIETQGRTEGGAAVWGACVVGANAFGNFAAAWFMHKRVPRWALIGIAYCAMGGASAGVFISGTPADLKIVLAFVFSAVGGLLPAAAIAGGAAHAPTAAFVAMASGFVVQGAALGSLVGPPIMATAVEGLGSWAAAWWVMLVVSAAGLGLVAALTFADRPRQA